MELDLKLISFVGYSRRFCERTVVLCFVNSDNDFLGTEIKPVYGFFEIYLGFHLCILWICAENDTIT